VVALKKRLCAKTNFTIVLLLFPVVLSAFLAEATGQDEFLDDSAKRSKIDSMYAKYRKSFSEVSDISAEQALGFLEEGRVIFVDVRKPEEQEVSMLPGAITDKAFLENLTAYAHYRVIGYCTISYRSGKLAQKLKKKGINMRNLRGGILAWLHAGGKVYKEGKPVNRVHVYGRKWDLAPSAYEAVR
jgi:sodium/bile acid cotransporter 7